MSAQLIELLRAWKVPASGPRGPGLVPLWAVFHQLGHSPDCVGPADVAAAVRNALLSECGESAYSMVYDLAREAAVGPEWRRNFEVGGTAGAGTMVKPLKWQPSWLEGRDPTEPLWAPTPRRTLLPVPADPFFEEASGYSEFVDEAQRRAVYSVLLGSSERTHIVVLPTGSGKTTVALVPAVIAAMRRRGTTVFVVPTVALALDLERRAMRRLRAVGVDIEGDQRLAYLGGLDEPSKEAIRTRIMQGTQGIVFATPESLLTALRYPLYIAVESGQLPYLIIDEAHLVDDWGSDFRPAFQLIAGLRRGLNEAARKASMPTPVTILMTATLTEDHLRTVATHFADEQPDLTASVVLRPEPAYWFAHCQSEESRSERLVELAAFMPRPFIVYTSTRAKAHELADLLWAAGYRRIAVITGDSDLAQRADALAGLSDDPVASTIDIVVATSAFGLGVDRAHIRGVVHACIPESIDRFYQEVGRAGRDGAASCSIVLYTDADFETARLLRDEKLITSQRARERWHAMFDAAQREQRSDLLRLRLPSRPGDLVWDSQRNETWNQRVLNLMARAHAIKLTDESPTRDFTDTETAPTQVVRLLRHDLALESAWSGLEELRRDSRNASLKSFDAMNEAMEGRRDIARTIAAAYGISAAGFPEVRPQLSCGGCPSCRREAREPYEGLSPLPPISLGGIGSTCESLIERYGRRVLVSYSSPSPSEAGAWVRDCADLARSLVLRGIHVLVLPEELAAEPSFRQLHQASPDGIVVFSGLDEVGTFSEFPFLAFVAGPTAHGDMARLYDVGPATLSVLVFPSGTRHPRYPATIEQVDGPTHELRDFLGGL